MRRPPATPCRGGNAGNGCREPSRKVPPSPRSTASVSGTSSCQPHRDASMRSNRLMYGLMSSSGEPSSTSTSSRCRTAPSRRTSLTTLNPMGFGRRGERVAKTPRSTSCRNGFTRNGPRSARWKRYSSMMCEKPSRSLSPSANSGNTSAAPAQPRAYTGCIGVAPGSRWPLRTTPMGRSVTASSAGLNWPVLSMTSVQALTTSMYARASCSARTGFSVPGLKMTRRGRADSNCSTSAPDCAAAR